MKDPPASPRLYLGLQALQGPPWARNRGFPRYVHDHTLAFLQRHLELVAGLVFHPKLPVPYEIASYCGFGLLAPSSSATTGDNGSGVPIFHVLSPSYPEGPLHLVLPEWWFGKYRGEGKLVVTLHDLIPLVYPDWYLPRGWQKQYNSRLRLVKEADHVIAVSQTTKNDAVRLLKIDPDRITVIYEAADDHFKPPAVTRDELRASLQDEISGLTQPFVLTMTYTHATGKRKNVEGAIAGYAGLPNEVRDRFQLVIAGHGLDEDYAVLRACAKDRRVADRIVFTGLISDDLLRKLYQTCEVFVFPSLYEGFGLPVLESMQCGAPVIIANQSAPTELIEVPEARFDPHDVGDISFVLNRVLTDADLRGYLRRYGEERARQFTWQRTADAMAEVYTKVARSAKGVTTRRISQRHTIAMCVASTPGRNAPPAHMRDFIQAVVEAYPTMVHLVVADEESVVPRNGEMLGNADCVSKITPRQFEWLAERDYYDHIVYAMGNDGSYEQIYTWLKVYPGTVWLRDVRLTAFYQTHYEKLAKDRLAALSDGKRLPPDLWHWAHRYPDCDNALLSRDPMLQHEQGIYVSGEVAHYARKLVVSSQFSKELLQIDSRTAAPIVVIPEPAIPPRRQACVSPLPKYGLPADANVVLSYGAIEASGQPEKLIDALAALPEASSRAILAFVGSSAETYRKQLEQRAKERGIGSRVLLTGPVGEGEIDDWLKTAVCAVQLHFPTDGEAPAAVTRCLAAGLPTIVNDHGPLRELPNESVLKLSPQPSPSELSSAISEILIGMDRTLRAGALNYASTISVQAIAERFWNEVICAR